MDSDEDDIWDYKSLQQMKLSQRSQNSSRSSIGSTKGRVSETQPIRKRSAQGRKSCTQIVKNENNKTKRKSSRKSEQIKQEAGVNVKKATQKSSVKKRRTSMKTEDTTPDRKAVRRDGRCPICQMPFSALSTIQTPSWHMDECQMCTEAKENECPAGLRCSSTIEAHYRRYRHTEIARSSKKKHTSQNKEFGNVHDAKMRLNFDSQTGCNRPSGVSHLMLDTVIEISSDTDNATDTGGEDTRNTDTKVDKRNTDSRVNKRNTDLDTLTLSDKDTDDDLPDIKPMFETTQHNSGRQLETHSYRKKVNSHLHKDTSGVNNNKGVLPGRVSLTVDKNRNHKDFRMPNEKGDNLQGVPDDSDNHKRANKPLHKKSKESKYTCKSRNVMKEDDSSLDLTASLGMENDSDLVYQRESFSNLERVSLDGSVCDINETLDDSRDVSDMLQDALNDKKKTTKVDIDVQRVDSDDEDIDDEVSDYVDAEIDESSLNDMFDGKETDNDDVDGGIDDKAVAPKHGNNTGKVTRNRGLKTKDDNFDGSGDLITQETVVYDEELETRNRNSAAIGKRCKRSESKEHNALCFQISGNSVKSAPDSSELSGKLFKICTPYHDADECEASCCAKSEKTEVKAPKETVIETRKRKNKDTQSQNGKKPKLKTPKKMIKKENIKVEKNQKPIQSFFLSKVQNITIVTDSESEMDSCGHKSKDCCMRCRDSQIKTEAGTSTDTVDKGQAPGVDQSAGITVKQEPDTNDYTPFEGSYSVNIENEYDDLAGGFFPESEGPEDENTVNSEADTPTQEPGTPAQDLPANDSHSHPADDTEHSVESHSHPADGNCSSCSNETVAFVKTLTDKVTQITKNAADILMAGSRMLYKQERCRADNSNSGHSSGLNAAWAFMKSSSQASSRGQSSFGGQRPFRGQQKRANTASVENDTPEGAQASDRYTKRSCPFYKKIPGTCFSVDAFRYGDIPDCKAYILSHFHYDHYGGLTKKFSNPIYCSQVTANLVKQKIRVDAKYLHPIPLNTPTVIENVEVTLLEANHCPGAALILFKLRNGKVYLHTGDFRANSAMESYPPLQNLRINILYLDTTYCDPQYCFPPQEEVIAFGVKLAREARISNPKTLIVCGSYTIGKERIFTAIASELQCKICVTREKKSVLDCLEDTDLQQRLSLRWEDSGLHVLPMNKMKFKELQEHLSKNGSQYNSVLGIEPTGWTFSKNLISLDHIKPKVSRENIKVFGIPYSEHSSFLEMKRFVQFSKPEKILPTVNNGNYHSRRKMEVIFEAWMEEINRKR